MLEHCIKKLCTMMAAAGMLGSTACENGENVQDSKNNLLDAQADTTDADINPEINFSSIDYGAPQGKDIIPEADNNSDDIAKECPAEAQCQPYLSPLEDNDPMLGKNCAPVSIIWFIDYQSPYDRKFWKNTLPLLKQDYISTGKAKLVLRDFPTGTYFMAQVAAEAAECAGEQGKYWEMHDKIFSEQAEQGDGFINFEFIYLKIWAAEIGLDMNKFKYCFDSRLYEEEVLNDYKDGKNAGVFGIPTFFINDEMLFGAYDDYAEYTTIIDEKLKGQCEGFVKN